jgi:hypothetical protein
LVEKRHTRRGQILSIDILVALVIFSFILIAGVWIWHFSLQKAQAQEDINDLSLVAERASYALFMTSGDPSHWDHLDAANVSTHSIHALGLRSGRHIDMAKVARLDALQATKMSSIMTISGLKGPGYTMALNVFLYNDSAENFEETAAYQIGTQPDNASQVAVREMVGLDSNATLVRLILKVWR